MSRFLTAALYKFVALPDFQELRTSLLALCEANQIRGTILLASEGINGTIAATAPAVATLVAWLRSDARLADIDIKYSWASELPFLRLKIRLKAEIVSMHVPGVSPLHAAGVYVSPQDWNQLVDDPQVVLVDARNDYEVAIGSFAGAHDPKTRTFAELPAWLDEQSKAGGVLAAQDGRKPKVAMFCTGGIRCEKSTAYLRMHGFDEVYHLQGGILKYLETVGPGESRWAGECFVFDERVSVGPGLAPGHLTQCRSCRRPVTESDKASPSYQQGVSCPACFDSTTAAQKLGFAERQRQVELARLRSGQHIGASMPQTQRQSEPGVLEAPVARLLNLLRNTAVPRVLVGLVGVPGAGKSTLATRLEQEVNQACGSRQMVALGMDGFHLTRAQLAAAPDPAAALQRRGAPWTFDPRALAQKLQALLADAVAASPSPLAWPAFAHGVGDPVPDAVNIDPGIRLVLVEGLYLLHQGDGWSVDHLFDEIWFLDVAPELAEQRLVARHVQANGLDQAQALNRVAWNDRHNAAFVLQVRNRAHWLVRG